jgi:hypothetical protein
VAFDRDQIEAKLALNLIASAEMPQVALDALEAGLDGRAIRRLAILERPTYFEVADVFPSLIQELGLTQITIGEAALRVAKQIVREILNKGDDPLPHLRDFESLWVRSGYADQIRCVGTLDDEVWIAQSTGRSDEETRDWVKSILRNFVQQS